MGWFSNDDEVQITITDHISAIALMIIAIMAIIYTLGKVLAKHIKKTATTVANREVRLNNVISGQ